MEKKIITISREFGSGGRKRRQQRFVDKLAAEECIQRIQIADEPVAAKQ